MDEFNPHILKTLYTPPPDSHKGQNGKLLLIGGSHLFHAASLWALGIASRLVDMVFYASVPENNEIVAKAKEEFRDGIVVPRQDIENYIQEADAVLIGPGMVRSAKQHVDFQNLSIGTLPEVEDITDEGEQTYHLTKYLLSKYPDKKWVIDAGALQMMDPEWLRSLSEVVITPHQQEFTRVFGTEPTAENVQAVAHKYGCIVLLKGVTDIVCSPEKAVVVKGGNAGMTKGGTGDVLAGLVAGLACKNDLFLAAECGSYINKQAGEALYEKVGPFFNSSDLVDEIPHTIKRLLVDAL